MDSTYGKFWRRGRPNVSNLIADIAAVSSGRMAVVGMSISASRFTWKF